ncbi:hypothetical protein [Mycobacterium camsae]|uniref:hypothetical protein n=1 Tax=Mycobacterium gordonae TaxID=1778 RepID=UPI00197F4D2E|nr:hypothetical protein [Mycobacterium gordonae]
MRGPGAAPVITIEAADCDTGDHGVGLRLGSSTEQEDGGPAVGGSARAPPVRSLNGLDAPVQAEEAPHVEVARSSR